jgi:L-seryl-tRNA(Ser) seleniumtransferase
VNASSKVNGVSAEVFVPPVANHTPAIKISWDQSKVKITPRELVKKLQDGSPSVEVMSGPDAINITVFMLQNGEDKIVAKRVQEELAKAAVS